MTSQLQQPDIENVVREFRQRLFQTHLPRVKAAAAIGAQPALTTRTSEAELSNADRQTFIGAYRQLINTGFISECVSIHADMSHMMHGSMGRVGAQRFLPWHRVFLYLFEQHLQALQPGMGVPYWDWSSDAQVPDWLVDYTPTVLGANGNPITVFRTSGDPLAPNLPSSEDVKATLADTDFTMFESDLEISLHNTVHVWVGGPMQDLTTAPADPLFWLHHANVDRIWESWRSHNPGRNPTLDGTDAVLDPWSDTEPKTRDLVNYHYRYDLLP
ncbi:MAG TPA: tyrosinase family protein [Pseudonocardiaceae bacterium]